MLIDPKYLVPDDKFVYTEHLQRLLDRDKSASKKNDSNKRYIKGSEGATHKWLCLDSDLAKMITDTPIEDVALLVPYIRVGLLNKNEDGDAVVDWVSHKFFDYQCNSQEEYNEFDGRPIYSLQTFSCKTTDRGFGQITYEATMTIKVHSRTAIRRIAESGEATYDDFFISAISTGSRIVVEMGYKYNGNNPTISSVASKSISLILSPNGYNVAIDSAGQLSLSVNLTGGVDRLFNNVFLTDGWTDTADNILKLIEESAKIYRREENKKKTDGEAHAIAEAEKEIDLSDEAAVELNKKEIATRINALPTYVIGKNEYVQLGDVFYYIISGTLAKVFNSISARGNTRHTIMWGRFNEKAGHYAYQPIYSFLINKKDLLNRIKKHGVDLGNILLANFINTVLAFTTSSEEYTFTVPSKDKKKTEDKIPMDLPQLKHFIETEWHDDIKAYVFKYYILDLQLGGTELNHVVQDLPTKGDKKKYLQDHMFPYIELFHMNSMVKTQNLQVMQDDQMQTLFIDRNQRKGSLNMQSNPKQTDEKLGIEKSNSQYKSPIFLPLQLSLGLFGFPRILPGRKFFLFTGYDLAQWDDFYNIVGITQTINAASITTTFEAVCENRVNLPPVT